MAAATDDYYKQLGHFTQLFAETEWLMLRLLWETVGISDEMGKAVLSGVKIDQIGGLVERALTVSPVPPDEHRDLKYILEQLSLINGVRNLIVHHGVYGIHTDDGPKFSTNRLRTLLARAATTVPISAAAVGNMNFDLIKINAHLVSKHLIPFKLRTGHHVDDDQKETFAGVMAAYDLIVRAPWKYKSAQRVKPEKVDKAARKAGRKRLVRQRFLSRERR